MARAEIRSIWLYILAVAVILAGGVVVAMLFLEQEMPQVGSGFSVSSNLGFFLLINLNILVLLVLGFLIIKNISKLLLDRRRGILGSRLRLRLVTAFVGLSLVPTVLLFFVAQGILDSVLHNWFSPQIASSVDGALEIAKYTYDEHEARLMRTTERGSKRLRVLFSSFVETGEDNTLQASKAFLDFLDREREAAGISELAVVTADGELVAKSVTVDGEASSIHIPGPQLITLKEALSGPIIRAEESLSGSVLRAYQPLQPVSVVPLPLEGETAAVDKPAEFVLIASELIPRELTRTLRKVISAFDDYRELRIFRRPIASSALMTLVIITLLVVFAAIWIGFYLARGLTGPIQLLASGTQQVAQGNLEHKIPDVGDDELSILVKSFNQMTTDLAQTNTELIERRSYMETVLASVGVGVITLDSGSVITTCNRAASEIIGKPEAALEGRTLRDVLPAEFVEPLERRLEPLLRSREQSASMQERLQGRGGIRELQVTMTKLVGEEGSALGVVLLFDDLTELVSAQRTAAWREVARRIAHEIKNPLTPIQLSAQRLERHFNQSKSEGFFSGSDKKNKRLVAECSSSILAQVEVLRNLVNEFSKFARMPKASPQPTRLNALIEDSISSFPEAHPNISFNVELDERIPQMLLDPDQLRRVILNLTDNAIASVESKLGTAADKEKRGGSILSAALTKFTAGNAPANGFKPQVTIRSHYTESLGMVVLEVVDNGIGIPSEVKSKVFEPYFTTKKGGTGLGLAIVNTIVTGHNGFVRMRDNPSGGTSVVIELPVIGTASLK